MRRASANVGSSALYSSFPFVLRRFPRYPAPPAPKTVWAARRAGAGNGLYAASNFPPRQCTFLVSSALLAELEPTECSQGYQTPPSLQALSRQLLAGVLWRGVLIALESNHHFYLCETCCTVVNSMFTHSAVGSSMAITCPGEGERQPGFYPGGCFLLPRVSTGFTGAGAVSTGFTGADILRGPMMTKL